MSRLSPGTLILGIFAVLFGLVGAYAVKQHLKKTPQVQEVVQPSRTTVPLASADIQPGRTLTLGDIMLVRMTPEEIRKKDLPPGFMASPQQLIGRIVRQPIEKGAAFVTTALYPEGVGPSVAERLKPGYRAVTVPLEDGTGLAALASPGAVVDVIFRTLQDEAENIPETTVTLLESVEVLAIDQESFRGAQAGKSSERRAGSLRMVTLAVSPEQASALKVVEGRGTLSLALRGPEEELAEVPPASPQTMATLLNLPEPEVPFTTQIYRRGSVSTATFKNGEQTDIRVSITGVPVRGDTSQTRGATESPAFAASGGREVGTGQESR